MNVCDAKDCNNCVSACGLCSKHYARLRRHGSIDVVKRQSLEKKYVICIVDGCNSLPQTNRGLCPKHYTRFLRHGDPAYVRPAAKWYDSTHRSWSSMKSRCNNHNDPSYKHYGGRGIKYDERWEKFDGFYDDMGERPDNTTLDRKDCNGDYNKRNCRWASSVEQANNRRNNTVIEHNGMTMTVSGWARHLGLSSSSVLHSRLKNGWGYDRALVGPLKKRRTH